MRQKKVGRLAGLLLTLALTGCNAACDTSSTDRTAQDVPQTSVVVLVDFSHSFLPLTPEDLSALKTVSQAIQDLAVNHWKKPVSIFWAIIGKAGLFAEPPCGPPVSYRQRLVSIVKREGEITSREGLSEWLEACRIVVEGKSQRSEGGTDISGSVAGAAESIKDAKGERILIILSDFVEVAPGGKPTEFKLHGDRVAMLWRPEQSDLQNQNKLFTRLDDWKQRFEKAGAGPICQYPIRGLTDGTLTGCLRQ